MVALLRLETGFCDLVHHVLAHVTLRGNPANLYDPPYVAWVERCAGPTEARALGADRVALARLLRDLGTCITVQRLAWLFADATAARGCAGRALAELSADDVAEPSALELLAGHPAAELLWCSALLELDVHAALLHPEGDFDHESVANALASIDVCAPRLAHSAVHLCRALTRHGRSFGGQIYVGVPSVQLGVSAQWVALQAAHEATVLEVADTAADSGNALSERAVEHIALVVLAERTRRRGESSQYLRWSAQWDVPAAQLELGSLPAAARGIAATLLANGGVTSSP